MKAHRVLHILRNPHGWSEGHQKEARLAAADTIEKYERMIAIEEYRTGRCRFVQEPEEPEDKGNEPKD